MEWRVTLVNCTTSSDKRNTDWSPPADINDIANDSLLYERCFELETSSSNHVPGHTAFDRALLSSMAPIHPQSANGHTQIQPPWPYLTHSAVSNYGATNNSQHLLQPDSSIPLVQQNSGHYSNVSVQDSRPPINVNPTQNSPGVHVCPPPQHKTRARDNTKIGSEHRHYHQNRDHHSQQHRRPHSDAERKYRHNMGDKFEHLRQRLIQSQEFSVLDCNDNITEGATEDVNTANNNSNTKVEIAGNGSGRVTDGAKINKAFVLEQAVALIDRLEGLVREQKGKIEVLASRLELVRDLLGGKKVVLPNHVAAAEAVTKQPEFEVAKCRWIP